MASDDVLWKQVEDLKVRAPAPGNARTAATNGVKTSKSTRRKTAKNARNLSPTQALSRSASRPVSRPANQPASQLTDSQSGRPGNGQQLGGRVVGRPVSFYIPVCIDEKIDDAVDYMQKRHGVKVDRSALVSAILGEPGLWETASLNQLAEKAVGQLTNRLASRLTSRPLE
jgi:hypothetical protein